MGFDRAEGVAGPDGLAVPLAPDGLAVAEAPGLPVPWDLGRCEAGWVLEADAVD